MKKYLSYLVIFLAQCCTPAVAQNLYVKVGATYGVSAADDNKRVSEFYASGQDTLMVASTGKPGVPWAWAHWRSQGMPYATFRATYLGCAIATDIAWRYEADANIKSGYQNTYAFADWTDASGHWYANRTMQIPRGGIAGQGSFGHYDDTNTSQVFATCEFEMTEDWWPANQTERRLFETPNSALGTPDAGSYNESFRIEGFRLQGPAIYGDGINRIGMFIRRPGECSYMNQVFAVQFQYGIMVVGGVPFTFGTLSAFFNEKVGVALMGGWGATFSGQTISGDNNGELFGSHPGYGDEAGGIISIGLLKNEDGLHAETPANPYRGQITAYLEGQYVATIGVTATSRNWITTDAAFVVNPRLTNGTPQASVLTVGGTKGYNYRTLIQNVAAGTRWAAPGDYQGVGFRHYASGNRMVINDEVTAGSVCNCPPLGFFRGNGTFDYVACTPARTGTVTPPPSGSWSCTPWSACAGGTQTRTCTCAGTCTAPKPAESQACTVTPPPAGAMTATASLNNVPAELAKITDGNASTAWLAGASMAVGQWVQVDYGATASRSSVSFDIAPGYLNSYPRTFDVQTSTNGTSWTTVKAGAVGTYPTCSASFTARSCRYIRITVKTGNPNWLGIAGWK